MKQLDLTATVVSSFSGRITTQIVKATRPNTLICCAGYKATKITLRVRPVPPHRLVQVLHSLPTLTSRIQLNSLSEYSS